jgi:hypothetical protein
MKAHTKKDTGMLGKGGCWPILALILVLMLVAGSLLLSVAGPAARKPPPDLTTLLPYTCVQGCRWDWRGLRYDCKTIACYGH